MKTQKTFCNKWILPAGIAMSLLAPSLQADTVTIRADEWYPYNGVPDSPMPGFMIEIAEKTLARAGHVVDYKIMPWERAVKAVQAGDIDCVVGAYKADAPDLRYPDVEQAMDDAGFYMTVGKQWSYSIANLQGKKLGVIGGYAYDDGDLDSYIAANTATGAVHEAKGNDALEKNIKMLVAGRLDVVVESPAVMASKLKSMAMSDKVIEVDRMNDPSAVYIACSPVKAKTQEYVSLLSDGTEALRASGELAKILDKYGLKDWK